MRRIRVALDPLVELEDNPFLRAMVSEQLDEFRDSKLPVVPARENKIRLQHGARSITESIRAVEGTDWPRISVQEQVKRLTWISNMFSWAVTKRWLEHDPCCRSSNPTTRLSR